MKYLSSLKRFSIFKLAIRALLISALLSSSAYASEGQHGIQVGHSQQRQGFTFEDQSLAIAVGSNTVQYQYSQSHWLIGFALSRADGDKTAAGDRAYQFDFDSRTNSVFAEMSLDNFWLGMGFSQGLDDSQYRINRSAVNGEVYDQSDFNNVSIDVGYGQFLASSYWSVSTSLTQQWLDTKKTLKLSRTEKPLLNQQSNATEQALFAALNARYEYYFTLSDRYELALSGALNHQFTLRGDGRIQFNRQRSKELTSSVSATTALSARVSLLYSRYSLSAERDQLTDQSAADAYYGIGLGVSF
ncbi:MAG: hypothetical protein ACI910_002765 [Oleispira sp.]